MVAATNAPNPLETVENTQEPLPKLTGVGSTPTLGETECWDKLGRVAVIEFPLAAPCHEQRLLAPLWTEEFLAPL
jgi:hypothetical protein